MATNFPTSLDNFTNPVSGNTLDSPSHSLQHSDLNDAVEALETKLGVGASPAGSATAGQVLTISAAGTSNWSTPTRDGLVQVIATSVAVGSGSGSVDANGAVTFSGASSISLNGCFSSTYDNYRILFFGTLSTGSNQTLRLRASGTDNSGATSYRSQQGTFGGTSVAAKRNDTSAFNLNYDSGGNEPPYYAIDIFRPNSTDTFKVIAGMGYKSAQADFTLGALTSSTQFDGFSLITSTGTMSGTVRVYGYRN